MQYAYINDIKSLPIKGANGICIGCGKKMVAKCGDIKLHHWAHYVKDKCDSWWENETEWHREWKDHFPEEYREITFYDAALEEYHRADIHTPSRITIEFQNSSLSIQELASRNNFYDKIIWVVNGKKFSDFKITHQIPNPNSPLLEDFIFMKGWHLEFKRRSEFARTLNMKSTELRKVELSPVHYSFIWNYPHKAWYSSSKPVFIDFGGHFLYWLRRRKQDVEAYFKRVLQIDDYWYLQTVSKIDFLNKYNSNDM